MAPSVEKKIAELEMGLLHLQQNIEIPEISLPIHPIITNVAERAMRVERSPKLQILVIRLKTQLFLTNYSLELIDGSEKFKR